ncbi:MAG: shikimate kinase [Oscillospiraceae bacterium]|nr:shikimate kinase [Oscillospiraceae bacterium]
MRRNLVLIGMPGSGKSAVGSTLARLLHMPFLDTDTMVVKAAGHTIPEIFAAEGEEGFRDRESAAVRAAARAKGAVIATGGGVIKRASNMRALARTGIIFFLDRPPEDIAKEDHKGRPLVGADAERIFALYHERIDLYRRYGQYHIANVSSAKEAADHISVLYKQGVVKR